MEKLNILYIGMHEEIRDTVVRLLNSREAWEGAGTSDPEEAKAFFAQRKTDILLLGAGLKEETETELRAFCAAEHPAAIVIQHYGGGSGLLANEILHAWGQRTV